MQGIRWGLLVFAGFLFAVPAMAQQETAQMRARLVPCYQPASATPLSDVVSACISLLDDKSWSNARLGGIYMSLANAYDETGDTARALADYNQAIAIDPGKALYFYNRGYFYYRQNDNDHADADFAQTVSLDPSIVPAHFLLGVLAERKGDIVASVMRFNETIALNPKLAQAYLARASAEGKMGQGDKAMVDIKMAISLDPALARNVSVDGKPLK